MMKIVLLRSKRPAHYITLTEDEVIDAIKQYLLSEKYIEINVDYEVEIESVTR